MPSKVVVLAAVLATAAAGSALAQTPAAGASPADVPKHSCSKPGEFPGSLASDNQRRAFQKEYVAYTECLRKFATDQQKLAEPHMKAANDTITEYNAAVKAYNDEVEKSKK
jgi:hypothetical protein